MSDDDAASAKRPSRVTSRAMRVWAWGTIILCAVTPLTPYIGVASAVGLLIAALVLRRRETRVRGMVVAGVSSLMIAGGSTVACEVLFPAQSEVGGKERVDHQRHDDSFERAFDEAGRAPGGEKANERRRPEAEADADEG